MKPTGRRVLIVDDEASLRLHLRTLLGHQGYEVAEAGNAAAARRAMKRLLPDVVLMDLQLPDADGCELMVELKEQVPDAQFIIITAHGSIPSAVKSTRCGAADYLTKPFEIEQLEVVIGSVLERQRMHEQLARMRSSPNGEDPKGPTPPPARSRAMRQVLAEARLAAEQEGIVLLLGESGTGKDYLARWIHDRSGRADGSYFSINCAALSPQLAESELFGHEPGAFTGTRGRKRGLLELAEGGSLLLNEIGEMSVELQSKLLTFLDTRSFLRVGGQRSVHIDTRLFAATNRDLREEVAQGRFRQDLYYRLNVIPIELPPLRERQADLPDLAAQLLDRLRRRLGRPAPVRLTPEAEQTLLAYDWPGNIRELRNVLERALLSCRSAQVRPSHLRLESLRTEWSHTVRFIEGRPLQDVTRAVARQLVLEALRRGSTRREAAQHLGMTRHALAYQLKVLDIDPCKVRHTGPRPSDRTAC